MRDARVSFSRRNGRFRKPLLTLTLGLALWGGHSQAAQPQKTLLDYKYFRSLCIDLLGRMPTEQDLAAFEKADFSLDAWLDAHLQGDTYADRLTRVYSDLLRPQTVSFQVGTSRNTLARILVKDDAGKDVWVYFRPGQRRARHAQVPKASDPNFPKWNNLVRGGFCLLEDETGLKYPDISGAQPPAGTAKPIDKAVLDQYTVVVKPWWLYADYKSTNPSDRYNSATWATRFPGYAITNDLIKESDLKTDTTEVRVCKEEAGIAQSAAMDTQPTMMLDCRTGYGVANSQGCGCGPGLEMCMPAATFIASQPRPTFISSRNTLLGVDDPTDAQQFEYRTWQSLWVAQEPQVFLYNLFLGDRDFREVVSAKYTYVNGPLAQFYKLSSRSNWNDRDLGPTSLPSPDAMPQNFPPHNLLEWRKVDAGPSAAGILTMPLFLFKYGTRRARAHAVYNMFLCRDFVAPAGLQLPPSKEPNLMKREGCAACHQTLEPLSSYFARWVENDWSFLDPKQYPVQNPACKQVSGNIPANCTGRYDNVFSTPTAGMLRGAYGSPDNADAMAQGLGDYLVGRADFAPCVAQNMAESFLGRSLGAEDSQLRDALTQTLVDGKYRVKPLVKALLTSQQYRAANNLSSTAWRQGDKQ
ncbi:MAG TPA: DUF1585 domain-containing protein [Pseudomonadota bacterium]|nr:DUF1585 domain-containing protein [Pseudomonadota bacterium]HNF96189.1 DUF1585 domain-containing protein [Pseudomonadota bacterium]HNK43365.1 DUF1585 domain-containing protein [Pseudomonadota bacterium]